ncbi:MAG: glycosyltransferase family 2 protein [Thermoplasmataceae archaeon]
MDVGHEISKKDFGDVSGNPYLKIITLKYLYQTLLNPLIMPAQIKYSICSTIYNSAQTLEESLEPLCKLGDEFEIIVIDNLSTDKSLQILEKYRGKVKYLSMKCTRGMGRQKAIEISNGEYIIQVDLDVKYDAISKVVSEYQEELQNYIVNFRSINTQCNTPLVIGRKNFFNKIGGYPDLNFVEDLYFYKKAEAVGILKIINTDYKHICLTVNGKSSGQESRYEPYIFKKIKRRVIACRDLIFVENIHYKNLMVWYKLTGIKRVFVGIPLYMSGKLLSYFVKVPKLDDEVKRIKNEVL